MLLTLILIQQPFTDSYTKVSQHRNRYTKPERQFSDLPSLQLRSCITSSGNNYNGNDDNYDDGAAVCSLNAGHLAGESAVMEVRESAHGFLCAAGDRAFCFTFQLTPISPHLFFLLPFLNFEENSDRILLGCSDAKSKTMKWKGKCISAHDYHQSAKQQQEHMT